MLSASSVSKIISSVKMSELAGSEAYLTEKKMKAK
jgi:hypothetical protein